MIGTNVSNAGGRMAAATVEALRPGHWSKNALLFVPLALGQAWTSPATWAGAAFGFTALSLAASAGYLVNDLRDIRSDREHPTKRNRPFARGALSPQLGVGLAALLAGAALIVGLAHSTRMGVLTGVYLASTIAYSTWLKREVLIDVGALACLYMLRLYAGGAGAGVELSHWLLTFSVLFFLSLALAKRHVELRRRGGEAVIAGRGYRATDWPFTLAAGMGAAFAAVVIFFLYLAFGGPDRSAYDNPNALWPIGGVLLVWLGRVWLYADRGELAYDPVEFAFVDPPSRVLGVTAAGLFFLAI